MMPSTQGHYEGHIWFDRLQRWSRDTTFTGNRLMNRCTNTAQQPTHKHRHILSQDAPLAITTGYPRLYRRIPHSISSYSGNWGLVSQSNPLWFIFHIQVFPMLGLQAPSGLDRHEQLKYGFQSNTTELLESHVIQPSTFDVIRMDTWRDGRVRVRLHSVHCYIKKVMEGHGRSWKVSEGSEISRRAK